MTDQHGSDGGGRESGNRASGNRDSVDDTCGASLADGEKIRQWAEGEVDGALLAGDDDVGISSDDAIES